jgi:LSD1 subclass zinc finger protein
MPDFEPGESRGVAGNQPAPILLDCPSCRRKLRLPAELAGHTVRCPACQATVSVGGGRGGTIAPHPQLSRQAESREHFSPPRRAGSVSNRSRSRAGSGTAILVLGIVACALGLLAFTLNWFPVVRIVGLVSAGAGLAAAVVGIVLAATQGRGGLGLPITGGGANLLALLLGIVMLVVARSRERSDDGPSDSDGKPPAAHAKWGTTIDPDGDCRIKASEKSLTIDVPATPHDLSAELGRVNAPRVLKDVNGDFSAEVKVCGMIRPGLNGSVPGRSSYQAGGLLLWSDGGNYVRLERAGLNAGGALRWTAAFEQRANGRMSAARSAPLLEQDTYLKMERRGNQLRGHFSYDGRNWIPLPPLDLDVTFPAKARIGVAVVNAAQAPLTMRFEDYQLGR